MRTDLFTSKKDQLTAWMKERGFFSTSQVMEFGLMNFYNRAIQTKGDFHSQGLIRELSEDEKYFRGFKTKQGVYEWVGDK